MIRSLLIAILIFAAPGLAKSPQDSVDELLAADRAFSLDASKADDPLIGLSPMFDAEVVMPVPGMGHAVGREAVLAVLRDDSSHKQGRISWAPIRGGISADGTQGFTYGFLSLTGGEAAKRERKYLAYWVKRPGGWRVIAYRQQVREAGETSREMLPPSLPPKAVKPVADPAVIGIQQNSVAAAEKAFSDRAQGVGLRAAFREFGRDDSMNMYNGAGFVIGRDAISAGFPEEVPPKIHWATERSIAASSGDLGVSIGTIWTHRQTADGKPAQSFPFFTVWRRDAPDQPWRYIAE